MSDHHCYHDHYGPDEYYRHEQFSVDQDIGPTYHDHGTLHHHHGPGDNDILIHNHESVNKRHPAHQHYVYQSADGHDNDLYGSSHHSHDE